MPKDADPLKDDEIAVIRDWISQGGKWPDGFKVEAAMVTDTDWWSLLPLMRPAVPSVARVRTADGQIVEMAGLPHNEIDKFIARKHQQLGLSFAPEASRQTLIRRLHFDLLGLPPSPEQIERFVDDPAPMPTTNWSTNCSLLPTMANAGQDTGWTLSITEIHTATTRISRGRTPGRIATM